MRSLLLLLPLVVACGRAAPAASPASAPAPPAAQKAAPAPVAEAPKAGPTEAERAARAFFEEEAMRKQLADAPKAKTPPPPPPPARNEAKGKLKTKPAKSSLTVTIESGTPAVGDKVELLRRVDPSLPLIGGSWLVIADTEVTAVAGSTVTLRILAEKAQMKVNGKKLDHFTPGVPIRLGWTSPAAPPTDG